MIKDPRSDNMPDIMGWPKPEFDPRFPNGYPDPLTVYPKDIEETTKKINESLEAIQKLKEEFPEKNKHLEIIDRIEQLKVLANAIGINLDDIEIKVKDE